MKFTLFSQKSGGITFTMIFIPWVTKALRWNKRLLQNILYPICSQLPQHNMCEFTVNTHSCIYLLSLRVQSHQKKARPKEPQQMKLSRPWGYFRNVLDVSSSAALVQSLLLKVALEPWLSLRPVSAVSPVVAVREAASQFQWSGGGAVPSHPWWGALHGREPRALQDLCRGGELWEPEGVPVRQPHRLKWLHHKVS